ncbi:MAG: HAD hydrolase-like protein [Promethearchaeota archaeon]
MNKNVFIFIEADEIRVIKCIEIIFEISTQNFSYKLITSYENSCASKPNLLYYQLIFKYLNLSANECIMVGDEDKDMVCPKLSSQTFLVHSINTELSS